ncbi:hypothetical protein ABVK25_006733 [Lepraria finkii]|uniref:RRM domain-containing protein n=1 Tax=Lepraria finkii TaxID=1340010 RepID=A0ABR4B5G3_9LECA
MEDYKENVPYEPTESWLQKKNRVKLEKKERQEKLVAEGLSQKREEDANIRGDAFKTLFVARLSYDTTEKDLEREFGRFGPIERIRVVTDTAESKEDAKPKKKKKSHRGYAFVVYEREKDMKAAYKETDGIRIKDRRVLVDVERGRTVKGWRPRRLGGGLGGRGYTKAVPPRPMGVGGGFAAPAGPGGFGSGFRGGFGGGPRGGGFRGGFRGGDRSDFRGGRGGIGYQGGGGFGGRSGYGGGPPNGYGNGPAPPPNAPSGPGGRGGFGGGFGGPPMNGGINGGPHTDGPGGRGGYGSDPRRNDYDDRSSSRGGGGGYGGDGRSGGITGSNREPVRPRDGGFGDRGYGDRDRDRGYGHRDDGRKRPHDDDGYDDPRKRRY